jgi:neutral ceramidase
MPHSEVPTGDSPRQILAGAASKIVTPDLGCYMAGFDARKGVAQSVHDDLYARTMVLDDGKTQTALGSVDVLGFDPPFIGRVRSRIQERTGIPLANIVLAATHTHCGPVTFNDFYNVGQPVDIDYVERLASGIVESAEQAFANRRPMRLRSGMVRVDGVAVNRRTPDAQPVDPYAGVLVLEEADGAVAAMAVNYSCHPTVLGPDTLAITADFPYSMVARLQQTFGAGTPVLYFNGAEGDLSIGHRSDLSAVGVIAPFRTFQKAEELGTRLAEAVLSGLSGLEYEEPDLETARCTVHLPLKRFAPLPVMRERREQAAALVRQLDPPGGSQADSSPELLRARQQSLYRRIEEYYAESYECADGSDPKTLAAEMTAIRIGTTAIVSLPGEVFVAIALEIRRRSPFPHTMLLGLANGYMGYLPTADADAQIGYEVVASRVTPASAGIFQDGAIGLLNSLSAGRGGD